MASSVATSESVYFSGEKYSDIESRITVCSWNINGIASYWKSHGNLSTALDLVKADIICFQETKIASPIDWYSSIADKYHSYFSMHRPSRAYSGTATFVSKALVTYKAQDGLCGHFVKSQNDWIVTLREEEVSFSAEELEQLDSEDHGEFVLFNVYAPNAYPDSEEPARYVFKLKYQYLLSLAICKLQSSGRSVMLVGDLNVTVLRLDHCDALAFDYLSDGEYEMCGEELGEQEAGGSMGLRLRQHSFESRPSVVWMRNLCGSGEGRRDMHPKLSSAFTLILYSHLVTSQNTSREGVDEIQSAVDVSAARDFVSRWLLKLTGIACDLQDTFRRYHPLREKAYTVWNTKTGARQTNYGTRLDYILVSRNLLSKLRGADIEPLMEGSDHCPVYCKLQYDRSCQSLPSPPPLCTCWLPGFAPKQSSITQHCIARGLKRSLPESTGPEEHEVAVELAASEKPPRSGAGHRQCNPIQAMRGLKHSDQISVAMMRSLFATGASPGSNASGTHQAMTPSYSCRDATVAAASASASKSSKPRQTRLSFSGVADDKHATIETVAVHLLLTKNQLQPEVAAAKSVPTRIEHSSVVVDRSVEADCSAARHASGTQSGVNSFRALFAPIPTPRCSGHNDECVVRVVGKEGPNCGRRFYCCAHPAGEKGNPLARCDFFQWDERSKPKAKIKKN